MADSFQKRQRSIRRKEKQKNKQLRKQERVDVGPPTAEDIARDYFDGLQRDVDEPTTDTGDNTDEV